MKVKELLPVIEKQEVKICKKMGRKPIPKKIREQVYQKYNGHCAYCGCKLEYKDMQVDHVIPVYGKDGSNDLDNLMPTCRMCNFYKSTYSLEDFRKNLETLPENVQKALGGSYLLRDIAWSNKKDLQYYRDRFLKAYKDICEEQIQLLNEGQLSLEDYSKHDRLPGPKKSEDGMKSIQSLMMGG